MLDQSTTGFDPKADIGRIEIPQRFLELGQRDGRVATREVAMRHSQELAAGVRHVTERTQPSRQSCRMFSRTDHFRSDRVVKRDPGLSQLGRKCCAELVFQTPDQRITKRVKVRSLNSEICMLPTRVPDDRLKQFMLIKCPNDCRDHVHELEVLSFHVAREQTLRIGSKLEEPAIEQLRDFASDGPDRIE